MWRHGLLKARTCTPPNYQNSLSIPLLKEGLFFIGALYIPFTILVIVGSSNAVNLTDGLDGLAIVPVMIAASSYVVVCSRPYKFF